MMYSKWVCLFAGLANFFFGKHPDALETPRNIGNTQKHASSPPELGASVPSPRWREAVKTSPLRQLTILYLDFSYKRQQTKTPRQVSQLVNDGGCVPTVTGRVLAGNSRTRGGAALARTGAHQRIVWRRAP